jgi:hypothetical protein
MKGAKGKSSVRQVQVHCKEEPKRTIYALQHPSTSRYAESCVCKWGALIELRRAPEMEEGIDSGLA